MSSFFVNSFVPPKRAVQRNSSNNSRMSHRGTPTSSSNNNNTSSGNSTVDMRERDSLLVGDYNTNDVESVHKLKTDSVMISTSNSFNIGSVSNGGSSTIGTSTSSSGGSTSSVVSQTGLMVLLLLAVQNCSKNLLMRYVMKDQPQFLTSAAVIGSEFLKLSASVCIIVFYDKKRPSTIVQFLREDFRNTLLLVVPASAYNLQMSLEYVALANLDAAMFSVLVQTKLLFTASFAYAVLRKRLRYVQVISLVLLTCGVMLCNLSNSKVSEGNKGDTMKGIIATIGIAVSSGFASVYTEKVIKGNPTPTISSNDANDSSGGITTKPTVNKYGLAYTQVQLALMSLVTIGVYAMIKDWNAILVYGLFHNFTPAAFLSIVSSAVGGLIVAAVLKYADSVLKGYATSMSVILTGVLSMLLFGTQLTAVYYLGIINVVLAVLLYNGKDLDRLLC